MSSYFKYNGTSIIGKSYERVYNVLKSEEFQEIGHEDVPAKKLIYAPKLNLIVWFENDVATSLSWDISDVDVYLGSSYTEEQREDVRKKIIDYQKAREEVKRREVAEKKIEEEKRKEIELLEIEKDKTKQISIEEEGKVVPRKVSAYRKAMDKSYMRNVEEMKRYGYGQESVRKHKQRRILRQNNNKPKLWRNSLSAKLLFVALIFSLVALDNLGSEFFPYMFLGFFIFGFLSMARLILVEDKQ